MKTFDEKELEMIEQLAGTGFAPAEIAEVLEVSVDAFGELYNDRSSDVYKRYRKGYLQSLFTLRKRIFKDAGHGSSPAQSLAKSILDNSAYKMQADDE